MAKEPTKDAEKTPHPGKKDPAGVPAAPEVEAVPAAPVDPLADPTAAPAAPAEARKVKSRLKAVPAGIAHIRATFNNTMVAITDMRGSVIGWSNSGRAGMKGSRKSTAFAATLVGQDCGRQAVARGMHEVEVRVQGAGAGRESAIRALQSVGLGVSVIKDVTPIAHNGCRPRKRRRV